MNLNFNNKFVFFSLKKYLILSYFHSIPQNLVNIIKKENREFKIVDVVDGNKLTDPVIAHVTGATICTPIKSQRTD